MIFAKDHPVVATETEAFDGRRLARLLSAPTTRRSASPAGRLELWKRAVMPTEDQANVLEQPKSTKAAPQTEQSLYDRVGGIFPIAAVIDAFSDAIIDDPIAGARSKNPELAEWHTEELGRLPGLKFMRTLWVAEISGGPFQYSATRPGRTHLGLEEAHRNLRISPEEFDSVAAILARTLDNFGVPEREKSEVLGAFAAHKNEVTEGWQDRK